MLNLQIRCVYTTEHCSVVYSVVAYGKLTCFRQFSLFSFSSWAWLSKSITWKKKVCLEWVQSDPDPYNNHCYAQICLFSSQRNTDKGNSLDWSNKLLRSLRVWHICERTKFEHFTFKNIYLTFSDVESSAEYSPEARASASSFRKACEASESRTRARLLAAILISEPLFYWLAVIGKSKLVSCNAD